MENQTLEAVVVVEQAMLVVELAVPVKAEMAAVVLLWLDTFLTLHQ
jgi:hypothetical protein